MKKILRILAVGVFSIFLSAGYAMATAIDFGVVAPTPGAINYDGLGGALIGTGIQVDNVTGLGTSLNNNVTLAISNGALNFTTGPFVSFDADDWDFAGGGSIVITGGIAALGIADGTTLLSGSFSTAQVDRIGGGTFYVALSGFNDDKNPEILRYYGVNFPMHTGNFNISFNATTNANHAITSTQVLSGDIVNVPEPVSMVLLGLGLLGVGLVSRKK